MERQWGGGGVLGPLEQVRVHRVLGDGGGVAAAPPPLALQPGRLPVALVRAQGEAPPPRPLAVRPERAGEGVRERPAAAAGLDAEDVSPLPPGTMAPLM